MSSKDYSKRIATIKVADALSKIEGVPVSDFARELSDKWAKGEIRGSHMKAALIAAHKKYNNKQRYTFLSNIIYENTISKPNNL